MEKWHYDTYLDDRLSEWARYYLGIAAGNEGWSKESIISIVMQMGILVHSSGPKSPIGHEKAEEVNFWVKKMGRIYPKYAEAICVDYFFKQLPLKVKAQRHGVSVSTFKDRVHSAKVWLSGHVAANDKHYGEINEA